MEELSLSPAEVNDLLRFSLTSLRIILVASLNQSPNKDLIVTAAHTFQFPSDDDSDHSYATFEFESILYFFLIEPDNSEEADGGKTITIGLAGN